MDIAAVLSDPASVICLATSVYAAGAIPVLLVGTEAPAPVCAAAARAADAAARAREAAVLDVGALLLFLSLNPSKGLSYV